MKDWQPSRFWVLSYILIHTAILWSCFRRCVQIVPPSKIAKHTSTDQHLQEKHQSRQRLPLHAHLVVVQELWLEPRVVVPEAAIFPWSWWALLYASLSPCHLGLYVFQWPITELLHFLKRKLGSVLIPPRFSKVLWHLWKTADYSVSCRKRRSSRSLTNHRASSFSRTMIFFCHAIRHGLSKINRSKSKLKSKIERVLMGLRGVETQQNRFFCSETLGNVTLLMK